MSIISESNMFWKDWCIDSPRQAYVHNKRLVIWSFKYTGKKLVYNNAFVFSETS